MSDDLEAARRRYAAASKAVSDYRATHNSVLATDPLPANYTPDAPPETAAIGAKMQRLDAEAAAALAEVRRLESGS